MTKKRYFTSELRGSIPPKHIDNRLHTFTISNQWRYNKWSSSRPGPKYDCEARFCASNGVDRLYQRWMYLADRLLYRSEDDRTKKNIKNQSKKALKKTKIEYKWPRRTGKKREQKTKTTNKPTAYPDWFDTKPPHSTKHADAPCNPKTEGAETTAKPNQRTVQKQSLSSSVPSKLPFLQVKQQICSIKYVLLPRILLTLTQTGQSTDAQDTTTTPKGFLTH